MVFQVLIFKIFSYGSSQSTTSSENTVVSEGGTAYAVSSSDRFIRKFAMDDSHNDYLCWQQSIDPFKIQSPIMIYILYYLLLWRITTIIRQEIRIFKIQIYLESSLHVNACVCNQSIKNSTKLNFLFNKLHKNSYRQF